MNNHINIYFNPYRPSGRIEYRRRDRFKEFVEFDDREHARFIVNYLFDEFSITVEEYLFFLYNINSASTLYANRSRSHRTP